MTPLTLEQRGIAALALTQGWQPFEVKGRAGWSYPVFNAAGLPYAEKRWKSCDGAAPKYLWIWSKPERAKYYFVPGAFSEIQNRHGNCWLAGGEPDVLAFNAAGIKNAVCWLDGEGSPPATLADDLSHMGVTLLSYAPDRDHAGMVSAHKVRRLLEGTGIDLILYQLPGLMDSKYDVGNLWIDCAFNVKTFVERLDTLPALDEVTAFLHSQQTGTAKSNAGQTVQGQLDDWLKAWQQGIMAAMGTPDSIEGHTKRWRCPLPGHDDQNPSFTFRDKETPGFYWPMCSCGIQDDKEAWSRLAEALNLDSWYDFKALQAASAGYTDQPAARQPLKHAPAHSEQLPHSAAKWVDMHDVYTLLKHEFSGEYTPEICPMIFPMTVLHRFGGYARFTRRKKLTAITGVSGGGKTLLLKTMMIKLMQNGHDVIWWGPEWDPYEYAEQDLQRLEGLTMDQLDEWRLWKHYDAKGLAQRMSAQYGLVKPGEAAIQRAESKIDEMLAWPGHMYIVDPAFDTPFAEMLDIVKGLAAIKRQEGRDPAAFAFDYVQLASKKGEHDWTWAEGVVRDIKAMCVTANLHGFVSSQVRKKDSEAVRDGEQLTQGSAQGLSDAQFNLYLTLTPEVDDDGQFDDTAWLNVVKNSRGKPGKARVFTDFQHLSVLDKIAPESAPRPTKPIADVSTREPSSEAATSASGSRWYEHPGYR